MLTPKHTRIIRLKDKELDEIYQKIQANDIITEKELNKMWDNFISKGELQKGIKQTRVNQLGKKEKNKKLR